MSFVFSPQALVSIPVVGNSDQFPVHRIYCVGKNYADHIREMGSDPDREEPCFFLKPTDAIVLDGQVPYPPGTQNLHYEGELVIAIGKGGCNITADESVQHIFGYAAGLDMTRRDLQVASGKIGMPWDTGKAFDYSAPLSAITPMASVLTKGSIQLWVNGSLKQNADISDLIWQCHEIIAQLSALYELKAGDLIFTGTPAGVGPVLAGDKIELKISGLESLSVEIK